MARQSGKLNDTNTLRAGDHVCWTYSSDYEHRRVLTSYFLDGVRAGDKLAYFAPGGSERRLLDYLDGSGVDADEMVASGRLMLAPAEDAYAPGGVFDPDDRITAYRGMVEEAVEESYPALRVAGEGTWIINDPEYREAWPIYELRADILAAELPFIALCAYDLRACDRESVRMMDAIHSLALNAKGPRSTFNVHADPDGGLVIEGEIDMSCSDVLRSVLMGATKDVRDAYIDVSRLTFADIDAARAIAAVAATLSDSSGSFELRGASRSFRKLWGFVTSKQASLN